MGKLLYDKKANEESTKSEDDFGIKVVESTQKQKVSRSICNIEDQQ